VRAGLVASALADALTALVLFLLVRRLAASFVPALAAAAAWGFLSPFYPLLEFLYPDPLGGLAVAAAAAITLLLLRREGWWSAMLAGIAWGVAIQVRPFLLPAAVASALPLKRKRALCLLAGLLLLVLPWTLRNALVFGRFIPLTTAGVGINFWVGTWNRTGPVMVLERGPGGKVRASSPETGPTTPSRRSAPSGSGTPTCWSCWGRAGRESQRPTAPPWTWDWSGSRGTCRDGWASAS